MLLPGPFLLVIPRRLAFKQLAASQRERLFPHHTGNQGRLVCTTLKFLLLWHLLARMKESPGVRRAMALPHSPAKRGLRSPGFICRALILVAGLVWSGDVKSMGFVSNPILFHWRKLVINVKPPHPMTQSSPEIIHSCSGTMQNRWSFDGMSTPDEKCCSGPAQVAFQGGL